MKIIHNHRFYYIINILNLTWNTVFIVHSAQSKLLKDWMSCFSMCFFRWYSCLYSVFAILTSRNSGKSHTYQSFSPVVCNSVSYFCFCWLHCQSLQNRGHVLMLLLMNSFYLSSDKWTVNQLSWVFLRWHTSSASTDYLKHMSEHFKNVKIMLRY